MVAADERVDRDVALRAYTADAAYACHFDNRGTLEPGKLADFVVLGDDPFTVDLDDLAGVAVDMTVAGGRIVHRRQTRHTPVWRSCGLEEPGVAVLLSRRPRCLIYSNSQVVCR